MTQGMPAEPDKGDSELPDSRERSIIAESVASRTTRTSCLNQTMVSSGARLVNTSQYKDLMTFTL